MSKSKEGGKVPDILLKYIDFENKPWMDVEFLPALLCFIHNMQYL